MIKSTWASAEVPAPLVATSVKAVAGREESGVPEMTQVALSTESPGGSAVVPLLIPQAVTGELFAARVVGATLMAWPAVPVVPAAPAKSSVGTSITVMLTVAEAEPLAFDAVTVNCVLARSAVGVPERAPEVELRESPAGSAGETA
jgi:hypothetical protein